MNLKNDLKQKHCLPCEGLTAALRAEDVKKELAILGNEWQVSGDQQKIWKDFRFKNYYQTIAFVNAIAWLSHQENHHPDLEVGYNHCLVAYSTHALNGLSANDFICAERVESLFSLEPGESCAFNEK